MNADAGSGSEDSTSRDVLYLFPQPAQELLSDALAGHAPREQLYGACELGKPGFRIAVSDDRWIGVLGSQRGRYRHFAELPNFSTLRRIAKADIVIVKDEFAVTHLLAATSTRTKLVYLDSLFDPPKRFWRRWSAWLNLRGADAVVAYSRVQATAWEREFGLPSGHIRVLPYCMDTDFYPALQYLPTDPPYVVAVGRDLGRDFDVLVRAAETAGVRVKLVTLPYLVPERSRQNPRVDVLERLSYPDLFALYAGALASVVPLKDSLNYPSGIRAVMEGALLGIPTIATATPILQEYFKQDEHVRFVRAGDPQALADEILTIRGSPAVAAQRSARAQAYARREFSLHLFASKLGAMLQSI